jgi:hypothetical protein
MAAAWIPIVRTVGIAYRDVWRAVRAVPLLVLISVAIVLALNLLEQVVLPKAVRDFPATGVVSMVVMTLVLTPLWLAIYRYLLTSEVAIRPAVDVTAPRFVRFFAWSVVLSCAWLPATLLEFMWPDDDRVLWAGWGVAVVAYSIAAVRLVMLFPAIAIDAPGAAVSNAMADSRGHFLNILLLYLAAATTMVFAILSVLLIVAIVAMFTLDTGPDLPDWVFAAIATVGMILVPAVIVGIDARIFQVLADRVRRSST